MTISGVSTEGMQASIFRQNVTANNLANVNTTAFKSSRALQADRAVGGRGAGVSITATQRSNSHGALVATSSPTDLALTGNGFFQLEDSRGQTVYSRSGNFSIDGNGQLVNGNGLRLQPNVSVPQGTTGLQVHSDGQITGLVPGSTSPSVIGEVKTVQFSNPAGLEAAGDNLFRETGNSGPGTPVAPGARGTGIQAGALETSNVDIATEMTQSILNTRTLQANAAAFRVQDRMMGTIIDLVR